LNRNPTREWRGGLEGVPARLDHIKPKAVTISQLTEQGRQPINGAAEKFLRLQIIRS
jgi:hypothetical protein